MKHFLQFWASGVLIYFFIFYLLGIQCFLPKLLKTLNSMIAKVLKKGANLGYLYNTLQFVLLVRNDGIFRGCLVANVFRHMGIGQLGWRALCCMQPLVHVFVFSYFIFGDLHRYYLRFTFLEIYIPLEIYIRTVLEKCFGFESMYLLCSLSCSHLIIGFPF